MKSRRIALTVLVAILLVTAILFAACNKTEFTVTFMDGDKVISTVKGKSGDALKAPSVNAPAGMALDGWATSPNGEVVELPSTITENATYYAIFVEGYTVTLDLNGGSLAQNTVGVKKNGDLYAALKDLAPTYAGDPEFEGWYKDGVKVVSGAFTVDGDMTVVAKYKVGYTVQLFLEMDDQPGQYKQSSLSGWGMLGEEEVASVGLGGEYTYTYVVGDIISITLSANASENVYRLHFNLTLFNVVFRVNAPEGATAEGEMAGISAKYNQQIAPNCDFSIHGYRFAGWAESADGQVKYKKGQSFAVTRALILYAVWDRGYVDRAGGDDVIFLEDDITVAYLQRQGFDEKTGNYDNSEHVYKFVTDAGETLKARLFAKDYTFAYYLDGSIQTYYIYNPYVYNAADSAGGASGMGQSASLSTIELLPYNNAVIRWADGDVVEGSYKLDRASGDYIFVYDDGTEEYFMLTTSVSSNKPVCFFRGPEEGMRYLYSYDEGLNTNVGMYLDGYGTLVYMDTQYPSIYVGWYTYADEDSGKMEMYVYVSGTERDHWIIQYFRVDEYLGTPVYIVGNANATVYKNQTDAGLETLELDGFSKGIYTKADGTQIEGTYTYGTMTYTVTFKGNDGNTYKFRLGYTTAGGYTFQDADPLSNVYWWYRGGSIYYVNMAIQGDGVVWLYLGGADTDWMEFAYGQYQYVGDGLYYFQYTEIVDVESIVQQFGKFYFVLGEYDGGTEVMPIFTIVYLELDERAITTSDGDEITLHWDGTVSMGRLTGSYTYYTGKIGQLVINIGTESYLFIEIDGEFYEAFDLYAQYHNNQFSYTLSLQLLASNKALLINYDSGAIIGYGTYSYSVATKLYSLHVDYIDTNYATEMSKWIDFDFVVANVYGEDMMIVYDSSRVMEIDVGSNGGSLRMDEYGYAFYKETASSAEIKCEYFIYGNSIQLYAINTGRVYDLYSYNLYSSGDDFSFSLLGDSKLVYVNDNGYIGPDHYILDNGGTGMYYNFKANGEFNRAYQLTWSFDESKGVYNVKYTVSGKKYDFNFQIDVVGISTGYKWTRFNLAVLQTVTDETQLYSYTVVDKDGETVIGEIYNKGFGNFYRNDKEDFEYAVSVVKQTTANGTYLRVSLLDGNGNITANMYYFDMVAGKTNTVWQRSSEGGVSDVFTRKYYLYEYGNRYAATYLTFDGHNKAQYYINSNLYATGTYAPYGDGYLFTYEDNGPKSFQFELMYIPEGYNVYIVTHEEYYGKDGIYDNGNWEKLDLDLYAMYASYVNKYGFYYEGNYVGMSVEDDECIIRFQSPDLDRPLYFRLNRANSTFELIEDKVVVDKNNKLVVLQTTDVDIKIPDGVTEIPAAFFSGNTNIRSIDLNGVTVIGEKAFYGCSALERVTGGNVTEIQSSTFYQCTNLREFDLTNVTYVGDFAFYHTNLRVINLANAIKVSYQAFTGNMNTETVVLGETLEYIGEWAFSGHNDNGVANLYEVYLPNLTYLGPSAFNAVKSMVSFSAPQITQILSDTFRNCVSLVDFDFTNITFIGVEAFQHCAFTSVNLPNVVTVGMDAFGGCTFLESIHFGASMQLFGVKNSRTVTIGTETYSVPAYKSESGDRTRTDFSGLNMSLKQITVDPANPYYKSENNCLIDISNPDYYTVLWGCGASTVPTDEKVKLIAKYAFADTAISDFVIPDNIVFFDVHAFSNCTKLVRITLGAGLAEGISMSGVGREDSFGGYAFEGCDNLKEVYNRMTDIPNEYIAGKSNGFGRINNSKPVIYSDNSSSKLSNQNDFVFDVTEDSNPVLVRYTGNSTNIVLPNDYNGKQYVIGANVFAYSNLQSVTLPNWMTQVDNSAFYGCVYLETINFGSGITSIGDYAFYGCRSLTSITIPSSVKSIGQWAFYNCTSLTDINFGNVEEIGASAFRGCSALTEVNLPSTLKTIGAQAFYYAGLQQLTIPGNVQEVKEYAFAYNRSLRTVVVEQGVTALNGQYMFEHCSALTSVSLPDTLVSLGGNNGVEGQYVGISGIFYKCSALQSIVLPNSLKYVGQYVFYDCTSLTEVTLSNQLELISDYMFYNTAIETLVIPDSVKYIGTSAFIDCRKLTTLYIGSGLNEIQAYAFEGCFELANIFYKGSAEQWAQIKIDPSYNDILVFVKYEYNYKNED